MAIYGMLLYKVMVANNNISNTFSPFAGVTLAIVGAFLLITFSTKVLCLKAVKVNLLMLMAKSVEPCWFSNACSLFQKSCCTC